MKKTFGILALTTIGFASFAHNGVRTDHTDIRSDYTAPRMKTSAPVYNLADSSKPGAKQKVKKDHLIMKHGQMMVVKEGQKTKMTAAMALSNGSKVGTDGTITTAGGSTSKLAEGQKIYMDGKLGKPKTDKKKDK